MSFVREQERHYEARGEAARFVRHLGPVTCVSGIPGTEEVVTSAYDGAVGLFDLATRSGQLLGYHDHLVNRVCVDSTGERAASSSSDYSIRIWNLRARCLERTLLGHSDDVEDFAFVSDDLGASVSRDWRILLWDLHTGAIVNVLEGHERDVLSVVHHDGRLYTAGDDMTLRQWDVESGRLLTTWGPFDNETDSCAIDTVHNRVVLGSDDGVIHVFEIDGGETVARIEAHGSGIKKVATCPKRGDILSAAYDQRILVWSSEDFELKSELEPGLGPWERSFNWSPAGDRILAGTFDGTVLLWDAVTGACIAEAGERGRGNGCLNDVASGPDGAVATVSDDGLVRLGRLTPRESRWQAVTEPSSGRTLSNAVAFDRALGVVTGAHDHKLHFFTHMRDRIEPRIEAALGEGPVNAIRVARHPSVAGEVFVACYNGAILRVDPNGEIRGEIRVHDGAVKSLRLHPSEPFGVSCCASGSLCSWDFDGNAKHRMPGHMAIVDDVDIDPTGRLIASVSRDFTLKIYDFHDGRLVDSVSLGRRSPKAMCFFDPRTVIVSNYWGELIRVDLGSKRTQLRRIADNGISAVARHDDHLVASSYDGAVYLVSPADLTVVNVLRCMTQRLTPSARWHETAG